MTTTHNRNAFDNYMFGGGLQAAAQRGVAQARADLIARGITPNDESNTPGVVTQRIGAVTASVVSRPSSTIARPDHARALGR